MASMPFALSVHNLISSVGADAGFASVIGLAILALLYFAHARETANLREEAAMLAQRLQEAEARLDAARRVTPVGADSESADDRTESQPAAPIPFAPAGLAAPALAAATRFIPIVTAPVTALATSGAVPAASSIKVSRVAGAPASTAPPSPAAPPGTSDEPPKAPEPGEAPGPAGAPEPAGAPQAATPPPQPVAPSAPPPPARHAPPAQPPFPARAPAPAPAAVTAFRTAPATVAGAAGPRTAEEAPNGAPSAPVGVIDEPVAAPPDPPVRSRQPSIVPPDRNVFVSTRARRGPPIGRRFGVLVGLLLVIGAVVAVIIATSGTGTTTGANSSGANRGLAPVKPVFDPALITVAVLNGTNTNQLAHHVADRLAAVGYKEGQIATASNQTLTSTVVGYLPGAANRTAALHVAKTLKLPANTVAPIDQAARAVACPPPSACTAQVVVTVGANLAAAY